MPEPEPPSPSSDGSQTARHAARCEIQLQNPGHDPDVGSRHLRPWLSALVADLVPEATSLAVRFVSDREMRQLNAKYRGKDSPTDVLSFPGDLEAEVESDSGSEALDTLSDRVFSDRVFSDRVFSDRVFSDGIFSEGDLAHEELADGASHLGDIVIAMPTARRQAQRAGHDIGRELKVLLLHGVLHCLGYDHETDDGTMERTEQRLRQQWIDHE